MENGWAGGRVRRRRRDGERWLRLALTLAGAMAALGGLGGCATDWNPRDFTAGMPEGRGFVYRVNPESQRKYAVFIPHDYDPSQAYPTILFFHGMFEYGDDPDKVLRTGLGPVVAARAQTLEWIVIFPVCTSDRWTDKDVHEALDTLQDVKRHYNVDRRRIIATGFSTGGYGVWTAGQFAAEEFAALVPISGWARLEAVPAVRGLPIWIYHNAVDPCIGAGDSAAMYAALKQAGAKVEYTPYASVGHDAWKTAYRAPEFWNWIGQQYKGS